MVDIASITAAVTGLKTATEIVKGVLELKTTGDIQEKVIELQKTILSAQSSAMVAHSEQFSLLEQVRKLEADMAILEAWEAEKKRFQLTDFGGGTFAYDLIPEMNNGEPPHRICASCFQNGNKSILQFQHKTNSDQDKYFCHICKSEFLFGVCKDKSVEYADSSWID